MEKTTLMTPFRQNSAWNLIKLYFQSEHRLYAYAISALIAVMTVALVGIDVAITYWFNAFYDTLQNYDKNSVGYLLVVFCFLAALYIVVAVYRFYASQFFGLRWRQWLTDQFVSNWLDKLNYYYLENFDKNTDNPDQRIQEDVGALINYSIELTIGFVQATATFFAFIYVLWHLSGVLNLHLGPFGIFHVPGYLVWVSIIYSVIGTLITFKIGLPLVDLNFEQQRREATFRFAAIDLRSHSENVALYQGESHQRSILQRLFDRVIENWYFIIIRQKLLLWFTAGYNQVSVLLPLLVALPNYFNKVFQLGGLMQSMRAFASIQDSTSFFVNSYTTIAQWRAVAGRLTTFITHMHDIQNTVTEKNQLSYVMRPQHSIKAANVSLYSPRDETLLAGINEEFIQGKHYLIKGPSGIGKSTFVRALSGIWPFGKGEFIFPDNKKIMYLPQKSYMPIGTLAEAVLFPDKRHPELEKELENILHDCHLGHFVSRLQETAPWSEQLSPGELQRIAFARILLHRPDWVFLDETTSMLDSANESYLYQLLKKRLPDCSIISVGHGMMLEQFHDYVIDMSKYVAAAS